MLFKVPLLLLPASDPLQWQRWIASVVQSHEEQVSGAVMEQLHSKLKHTGGDLQRRIFRLMMFRRRVASGGTMEYLALRKYHHSRRFLIFLRWFSTRLWHAVVRQQALQTL